jgi:ABC-type branched-chain amino acid transport systems, periplasmic component
MKQLIIGLMAGAMIATPALSDIKIGMITTPSGGGASLGVFLRDGFEHAIKERGGSLGGVAIDLTVVDDALRVENAKHATTRMIITDDVDILTGILWSNLTMAVVPGITRADKLYLSMKSGPSALCRQ